MSALSTDWLPRRAGPAPAASHQLALSMATDQRRASYVTLDAASAASREALLGMDVSPLWNLRMAGLAPGIVRAPTSGIPSVGSRWDGRGAAGPAYLVAGCGRRPGITLRADLTFSPRLALQLYAQPFGQRRPLRRLPAPGGAARPGAGAPFRTAAGGRFDPRLAPDAERRSLNANLVLRWEYRRLSSQWSGITSGNALSHDVTLSPGSRWRGSSAIRDHVPAVKLSRRFRRVTRHHPRAPGPKGSRVETRSREG